MTLKTIIVKSYLIKKVISNETPSLQKCGLKDEKILKIKTKLSGINKKNILIGYTRQQEKLLLLICVL